MKQTLFSKKAFQSLLFGFLIFFGTNEMNGQAIVTFPTSWTGTTATVNATTVASNINTPVTCSRGTGLTGVSSSARFNSSGWSGSSTLTLASNNSYLTFTVTAASGFTLNLNSSTLSFTLGSSGTGPSKYGIYTSVGGFTSTSNQIGADLTASSTSVTFPSSGYSGLASIQIRIYGWNASTPSTGTGGFSRLGLTGTVVSSAPTYSVTYNANSATSGTVPTDASTYANAASVTVKANTGTLARTGYAFSGWNTLDTGLGTDYAATGSATFSIGSANVNLYAKWTPTYTLTYSANANGIITGTTPQTVTSGASGTAVTATPSAGYSFVSWSDGVLTASRTDSNVTANGSVSATFAINTYSLTYTAGANGSLTGTTSQTVNYNASGSVVTAVPATGYHFVSWSDASTANPRTDSNVTANVSVSATFAIDTFTLTYTAGANGSITGTTPQTVNYNTSGSAVTAVPATGYHFVSWSDASTANPRTDTNVMANFSASATFAINTYTVTFDCNSCSSTPSAITGVSYNSGAGTLPAPEKSGFNFDGWYQEASLTNVFNAATPVIADITVYAKWTSAALASQTITFNALSPLVYSTTTFDLSATIDSPLTISYSSSNTNVATVSGNTVTLVGVGSTIITASQAGDASYNPATSVTQTLVVTPKELTIASASASDKTYDRNTTTVLNGTLSGVINSDAVSLSLSANFDTATAGTLKSVTSTSTLGGAKAGNYTLTQPTGLTAAITVKTLTVNGATVTTKSYTGTNAATLTGASLVGVIVPDAVGVTGGGTFAQANVGTVISVTTSLTLNGADAGNYSVSQPSGLTGTITTSGLTLNGITGTNKVYDATTVATISGIPAYVGLQNGETFSVTGTPVASFDTKGIGTAKAITISNYTAPSANYTLTQPTGLTGNVTAATLTVNGATAANKVFNGTTAATTSGGTFVGVLSTDVVTLSHGAASFASSAVGTGIVVTSAITATGTDGANYIVTQPTLTANITEAPVVLAGWDFSTQTGGTGNFGTSPLAATTQGADVTVGGLTRGTGFGTLTGSGVAANWGSVNFTVSGTLAAEITANKYFTTTITANTGKQVSLKSISAYNIRRSGTGPTTGQWQYQIGSNAFVNIGSAITWGGTTSASGNAQPAIDLSGITALQDVLNTDTITIRLVSYGATSTGGTNYLRDLSNTTGNDFIINGNVTVPKIPPTLTSDTSDNTVDNNNDITFTDDATWRTKITAVKIGTTVLTPITDYEITSGTITLKPSGGNALLYRPGSKSVVVIATGYTNATVTQVINPGIPTANSTATISAILAPNATRTITCTALDQYSNYVSGYTFKYTATITNSDATTNETYTIDGSQYSATTTQNVDWNGITPGITTFTAALPSIIDATDGISIQIKLADGTTTIGSPFAYHELPGQTITFNSLSNVTYGDGTYDISATGGASGNPVVFSSSDTSIATCTGTNGTTITVVGPGTCTIYANQAGNAGYNTAAEVSQPLTVDKKALTITGATAQDKIYNGNNVATITGTLSATTVGSDVVTLTLSGTFADVNAGSAIAVTSTSTLGGTHAGKYTLTQPTGLTANITQVATNTINGFGTITNKIIGQTFTLAATSTSGLAVTYSSSNENVATISGNTFTSVGVGITNITASQAGNGNYVSATSLAQELIVTPVPIAAWDFTGVGNYTTIAATTFSSNLVSTSNANTITRGSAASSSSGANSFRTTGFQNNGISTSNTDYFQVTLAPITGQNVSLSTINVNFVGTNTFIDNSANSGGVGVTSQYAYSLDGTNFTLIGLPVTSASLKPAEIDLSGVAALQGVPSGTTITLRYYASGQTTTGGWGFNSATAGTNGLSIGGSVAGTPTTTWDGSVWSDGTPTISKNAVIDAAYSTTDYGVFSANTLIVNNGYTFTINSGHTITVRNSITNNGSFIVENNANLIQANNFANTGNITVKRDSALLLRLDHTLWSSPVTGSQTLQQFSPNTLPNRFYTYSTTSNSYSAIPATSTFTAGKGVAIRASNTHSATTPTVFSGTFTGVPNNGNVPFTLATDAVSGNNFNLVGNPYPSTIDVAAFLNGNLNVAGTIYFYTHSLTMNAAGGFAGSNYTLYNSAGYTLSVHANGDPHPLPSIPNGKIQVGQGFIVKSSTGGTVTFTNAMRRDNHDNQFLRTAEIEKHRIWLNLKTDTGSDINQMMVGYIEGATQAVDFNYDGLEFGNAGSSLTSKLEGANYNIQGRSLPFASNDVVPLSFKASAVGNYLISLTNTDGLFAGSQDVFVRDNLIGTDHNIKVSPYTFASDAGTFDSRFELVYTQALGIPSTDFTPNSVIVYKNTDWFHVNTKGINMKGIQVYDVSGRLIYKLADINATTAVLNGLTKTNEVLFLKITSEDNLTVTVKVIN